MDKVNFMCHECGSFTEGAPNVLPKGWIIPKHSIVEHQNVDPLKRTAPPGTVIALCSVSCFNNATKDGSNV